MPVTQTDHHNTDMTEILLALRLEDFDLAPVLEAVEDLQLNAGCLQLLTQSATIEMFVLTRPSLCGIMNT